MDQNESDGPVTAGLKHDARLDSQARWWFWPAVLLCIVAFSIGVGLAGRAWRQSREQNRAAEPSQPPLAQAQLIAEVPGGYRTSPRPVYKLKVEGGTLYIAGDGVSVAMTFAKD